MTVERLTDLPRGQITYYSYADLDAGRIPERAVVFVQTWQGRRYSAGGVLAVEVRE